ncbi:MAG: 50S ribosomal protein L18 [Planctomycetota bacterium]|nr:50S ribosomal protein L18 [Planctomycetota bacterium]
MNRQKRINKQRERRAFHTRKRVQGEAARPRLSVYRSNKHIYAQLVDDERGVTLCASSSRKICGPYGGTVDHAKQVGSDVAEKALALEVKEVRFDRGAYRYHGRVRALADAAREKGLVF